MPRPPRKWAAGSAEEGLLGCGPVAESIMASRTALGSPSEGGAGLAGAAIGAHATLRDAWGGVVSVSAGGLAACSGPRIVLMAGSAPDAAAALCLCNLVPGGMAVKPTAFVQSVPHLPYGIGAPDA